MLYDFLKDKMLQHPNQVISNDTESITYSELIEYAESFGKTLTKDKYGLLFNSDLDTAKVLLACLYANKTAVLLSKRYGEAHTQRIIDTVKLSYLITEDGIENISNEQDECEDLSDVALIMSTSGTTGMPKSAMITHNNLISNLNDICKYFAIDCLDHILIARPLYHCAVLTGEFLISLLKGLRISFMTEGFVPYKISKKAKELGVTTLCGTPTLLYHLSAINLRFKEPLSGILSACIISNPTVKNYFLNEVMILSCTRKFIFGYTTLAVQEYILKYIDKLYDGSIPYDKMDWRIFRMIWEHKKLMLERIIYIEECLNLKSDISKKYEPLVELANSIRMLYAVHHMKRRDAILIVIRKKLIEIMEEERKLLEELLEKADI